MPATTHDPVHRARYSFEPDGENLLVDTWIEPGGGLPPHLHPNQEEVWSVLDGEVRFQLGSDKRVIGPEDGEMVVGRARSTRSRASWTATPTCAATSSPRASSRRSSRTAPRRPARGSS